jgi:glycosyltransferase involved in cell wall biosynthesis
MSSSLPTVSVIVPCYNYGQYLPECVESILSQTGVEVSVMIVDDASTDSSAQVAADLASRDRRIELMQHRVNLGAIRTFNDGLFTANGKYTVLISADDLLTPGSLARACALMEAHSEVGFVYGRPLVFFNDRSRPQPVNAPARWSIWRGREWFDIRCRLIENCIRSPEAVMRTRMLRQFGGFHDLPHAGDLELWMRFALYADVGYVSGPEQAYYRDHTSGLHRAQYGSAIRDHKQITAAFDAIFQNHKDAIADHARAQARVALALRRRALRLACRAYDREPFDPDEAAALEAMATGPVVDIHIALARCALRVRKLLRPRGWRSLLPVRQVLTTVPRYWNRFQYLRLRRAGLLL